MSNTGRPIIVTGPPGVGKTTLARVLRDDLGVHTADLDQLVEARSGRSVPDILRGDGEAQLRRLEAEALEQLDPAIEVLALGGGTLTSARSRRLARDKGPVIGLVAPVQVLRDRLAAGAVPRPLLDDVALETLLSNRREAYRSVDALVSAEGSPAAVAKEILARGKALEVRKMTVGTRATRVTIGRGLATGFLGALSNIAPRRTVIVISDRGVPEGLRNAYVSAASELYPMVEIPLPGGETVKDWTVLGQTLDQAVRAGGGRQSAVVGLGGGAICDLAAMVAALLGRGAPLVLVPTTLLAQADAAIGGKCAVNLPAGRNLAGTFYPAWDTVVDADFLPSLSKQERRSGLAEVLKAGIIGDPELFEAAVEGRWSDERLLARAIAVKAAVVEEDPFEAGQRKVLNLGHTLGHALEVASRYELRHGEAVAVGIATAARLSAERGLLDERALSRILGGLSTLQLPTSAEPALLALAGPELIHDKKGDRDELDVVAVREVGKVEVLRLSFSEATAALLRLGGRR